MLEKRHLDQALCAKEFAVLAGVSYSTARNWFRVSGVPYFREVVFWQNFAQWRTGQNVVKNSAPAKCSSDSVGTASLPARAARILLEA